MRTVKFRWTKQNMEIMVSALNQLEEIHDVCVLSDTFLYFEFYAPNHSINVPVRVRVETQNEEQFGMLKVELYQVDEEFTDIFFAGMRKLRDMGLIFSKIYANDSTLTHHRNYFDEQLKMFQLNS